MNPDRHEAARLLRAIRRAGPGDAGDLVDWAFSLMPHRPQVRRFKIEQLLAQGHLDDADALIAQGLLGRADSLRLHLLRARSLAARGDETRARADLRVVLAKHPHHRDALRLAARLALRAGEPRDVIGRLERALARREDTGLRRLLTRALLADGQPERAGEVLWPIRGRDPLLHARLRRQQGRHREAFEILEQAVAVEPEAVRRDRLLVDQLELLEAIGDRADLESRIDRLDATTPRALVAGAAALLSLGDFRAARRSLRPALRIHPHRRRALHLLIVAAALDGRALLARRALDRLRATRKGVDPELSAEAWRRGMLGAITRKHESAIRAGTDPSPGVLGALLQRACRLFEVELASADDQAERDRLGDCHRRCRLALESRQAPHQTAKP